MRKDPISWANLRGFPENSAQPAPVNVGRVLFSFYGAVRIPEVFPQPWVENSAVRIAPRTRSRCDMIRFLGRAFALEVSSKMNYRFSSRFFLDATLSILVLVGLLAETASAIPRRRIAGGGG